MVPFICVEAAVVEPYIAEEIHGVFDATGTPVDVTATMLYGGTLDFHATPATPVDPSDPNASEVAWWETMLSMKGWDVNQPADPNGDVKYLFIPTGAQGVSVFQVFYYKIYGAGGNGQFYFDCKPQ